ncbi:MAG: hypothetical protein ACK5ZA_02445, partial [Betaproteobacteria bacterium]
DRTAHRGSATASPATSEDWYRYCDGVVRPWGITRIPLRFSPEGPLVIASAPEPAGSERVACFLQAEPARQLPNLAKVPIAIVTGAASFRATVDHGTSRFLSQAGVANSHIRLEEVGLHGNGHMMMMERNSDEIAAVIAEWIERALGSAPASGQSRTNRRDALSSYEPKAQLKIDQPAVRYSRDGGDL